MYPQNTILIFDVGKTNKKILLFNERYELIFEEACELAEICDEDGDPCEDVEALTSWLLSSLDRLMADTRFAIRAINFSSYGASLVYLDEDGKVILPIYNYLKPFPEDLKNNFLRVYGGDQFELLTASPVTGNLNAGLQIYRAKHEKKDAFSKIKYILHLPQYLSFVLTGKPVSEITSIGCHTSLWNLKTGYYHDWILTEGIKSKLAPIRRSDHAISLRIKGRTIPVGIGLHDSSAALIPYLKEFQEPFILISSGTWCISLNAFHPRELSDYELKQGCTCYLADETTAVKASRIFIGTELQHHVKKIAEAYHTTIDHVMKIPYNPKIDQKLRSTDGNDESYDDKFSNLEADYHAIMKSIVNRQKESTELILHDQIKKIFVNGGFSQNEIYMNLLASHFPDHEVYASSCSQGSALGAALVLHEHWNHLSLANLITLVDYSVASINAK